MFNVSRIILEALASLIRFRPLITRHTHAERDFENVFIFYFYFVVFRWSIICCERDEAEGSRFSCVRAHGIRSLETLTQDKVDVGSIFRMFIFSLLVFLFFGLLRRPSLLLNSYVYLN